MQRWLMIAFGVTALAICFWLFWIIYPLIKIRRRALLNFCHENWRSPVTVQKTCEGVPWHFIVLLIISEDDKFFHHLGINFSEMFCSLLRCMSSAEFYGGSSISQQVLKRCYFRKWPRVFRKLVELVTAPCLELVYSKNEILSIYLQVVCLGPGVFGFANGAQHFFQKKLVDLTIAESFILISMLPSPVTFCKSLAVAEDPQSQFDYSLAYEKILYCLRVLESQRNMPSSDNIREFSLKLSKLSQPLCDPAKETNLIEQATREVYCIPESLLNMKPIAAELIRQWDVSRVSVDDVCTATMRALIYLIKDTSCVDAQRLGQDLSKVSWQALKDLIAHHSILDLIDRGRLTSLNLTLDTSNSRTLHDYRSINDIVEMGAKQRWSYFSSIVLLAKALHAKTREEIEETFDSSAREGWGDDLIEGVALVRQFFDIRLSVSRLNEIHYRTISSRRISRFFERLTRSP